MVETFVVVGGDAAGMSAASKAKRDAPDTEVIVFEKGQWVSYSACGMPYFIEGVVEDLEDLVAITPETFVEERGIDLRLGHEVVEIDSQRKVATVRADGNGNEEFEQAYDALLVATGARATRPPISGTDLACVFTLRSLDEAYAIRERIDGGGDESRESDSGDTDTDGHDRSREMDMVGGADPIATFLTERGPTTVGVIGGGYVGLELADALRVQGCDVHLFQRSDHVLSPYDADIATIVEDHLREAGVTLHLGAAVTELTDDGAGEIEGIETEDGTIAVDMVIVGTGVAPNVELATDADAAVGETGALSVDAYGETSLEGVYAAGDCAEVDHVVAGEPRYLPLALTANRHGRAIGRTVAGTPTRVGGVVGTAVTKVGDLEVVRTGITNEDDARDLGYDPVSRTITTGSRASYYPGYAPITVRMVADRESERVLGAGMVGTDRVAKRIDTVATALHAGMTVPDVENLDLAYAPPFGPVWDPVLTAAKVLRGAL